MDNHLLNFDNSVEDNQIKNEGDEITNINQYFESLNPNIQFDQVSLYRPAMEQIYFEHMDSIDIFRDFKTCVINFSLAKQYTELKQYQKAIDNLSRIIELNPGAIAAYNNRGNLYFQQNKYSKAMEDYNAAIKLSPSSTIPYINRGILHFKNENYSDAIVDLNKVIDLDENTTYAYINLGEIQSHTDLFDEAISSFTRAIEINKENVEALNARGVIFNKTGKFKSSVKDFTTSLEIDDSSDFAYFNRANNFIKLGLYEEALFDLASAFQLQPYNEKYCKQLVSVLKHLKRYHQNIELVLRILSSNINNFPKDIHLYKERASIYSEALNLPILALKDVETVFAIDETDSEANFTRGELYFEMGYYKESVEAFSISIIYNSEFANAYNLRSRTYSYLGKPDNAISDLTKALEIDKDFKYAYYNRGNVFNYSLNKFNEAIDDYTQYIKMDPTDYSAYYNRGLCYKSMGEYSYSIDDFNTSIELNNDFTKAIKQRDLLINSDLSETA